jgi:dipeptidyl aminopeptidase/acylaminoacyl peptidase
MDAYATKVSRRAAALAAGLIAGLTALAGIAAPADPSSAADVSAELESIFRPFDTDRVTLSPDGHHLAYTQREKGTLILLLRDLDANTVKPVPIGVDEQAVFSGAKEKTPARLTFLRWAANGRIIFNLNSNNIWSLRADGSDPRRLTNPSDFLPPRKISPLAGMNLEGGVPPEAPPPDPIEVGAMNQSLQVLALPRGDRHVYVEATAYNRITIDEMDSGTVGEKPPPHVVIRIDTENGDADEWGELEARASGIVTDQEGYPRIARIPPNASSVTRALFYAPRNGRWKRLDDLIRPPLHFDQRPQTYLGERSIPLAFDFDPNVLLFTSNVGRDTFGVYGLNVKTGQRTDLAIESSTHDMIDPLNHTGELIFDGWTKKLVGLRSVDVERATLWFEKDFNLIQRSVEKAVPGRTVELVEWDEHRQRFLVRTSGPMQPDAYGIFYRDARRLDQVLRVAPWLDASALHPTVGISFTGADGRRVTGYLTLPRRPLLKRSPLVALLHDGPWSRDEPGFDRESQALAAMGFAVVRVNYRGSSGFGRQHLDALRGEPDAAALEDVVAAVDKVIGTQRIDPRLVAVMGRGFGGYLALRAMQVYPKRFRCAVAIDAAVDLPTWINTATGGLSFEGEQRRSYFGDETAKLRQASPLAHPEQMISPVMLIEAEDAHNRGTDLNRALQKLGREVSYLRLNDDEAANLPHARAALFLKIRDFFNVNIYNYAVKIGPLVEKREAEPGTEDFRKEFTPPRAE